MQNNLCELTFSFSCVETCCKLIRTKWKRRGKHLVVASSAVASLIVASGFASPDTAAAQDGNDVGSGERERPCCAGEELTSQEIQDLSDSDWHKLTIDSGIREEIRQQRVSDEQNSDEWKVAFDETERLFEESAMALEVNDPAVARELLTQAEQLIAGAPYVSEISPLRIDRSIQHLNDKLDIVDLALRGGGHIVPQDSGLRSALSLPDAPLRTLDPPIFIEPIVELRLPDEIDALLEDEEMSPPKAEPPLVADEAIQPGGGPVTVEDLDLTSLAWSLKGTLDANHGVTEMVEVTVIQGSDEIVTAKVGVELVNGQIVNVAIGGVSSQTALEIVQRNLRSIGGAPSIPSPVVVKTDDGTDPVVADSGEPEPGRLGLPSPYQAWRDLPTFSFFEGFEGSYWGDNSTSFDGDGLKFPDPLLPLPITTDSDLEEEKDDNDSSDLSLEFAENEPTFGQDVWSLNNWLASDWADISWAFGGETSENNLADPPGDNSSSGLMLNSNSSDDGSSDLSFSLSSPVDLSFGTAKPEDDSFDPSFSRSSSVELSFGSGSSGSDSPGDNSFSGFSFANDSEQDSEASSSKSSADSGDVSSENSSDSDDWSDDGWSEDYNNTDWDQGWY